MINFDKLGMLLFILPGHARERRRAHISQLTCYYLYRKTAHGHSTDTLRGSDFEEAVLKEVPTRVTSASGRCFCI